MTITKFEEKYIPEPNTGCWIWIGATAKGYGRFRFNGKAEGAHRVSHLLSVGDIPEGMHVLHKCDTPLCVNPTHLFLGTHADNLHDAAVKKRFPCRIGSRCHRSKLTRDQVTFIRKAYSGGTLTMKQLGDRFGVKQPAISKIVNFKTHYEVLE